MTTPTNEQYARFFSIVNKLPVELRMMICTRVYNLTSDYVTNKEQAVAFKTVFSYYVPDLELHKKRKR